MPRSRCLWLLLVAFAIPMIAPSAARAQWLGAGPLGGFRLRLPLVSVDVGPGGATSVRAPLTAVDTPGYRYGYDYPGPAYHGPAYGGPAYGGPAYGPRPYGGTDVIIGGSAYRRGPLNRLRPGGVAVTAGPQARPAPARPAPALAELSDAQLAARLNEAAQRLHDSLARRSSAEVWSEFLRPRELASLTAAGDSDAVAEVLQRYDGVVANAQLAWLSDLDGFASTRRLLHQWQLRQLFGDAARGAGESQPPQAPRPQATDVLPAAETIPTPEPQRAAEPKASPDPEPVRLRIEV